MNIEPLRHYATPQLPTHDIVSEHPELLRLLPKRWQGNSAVVAALAACIAMSTCAADAATTKAKPKAKPKPAPKIASRIAPIFTHGSGIGSFGCEVVNPPTFLSEAEARQVIIEEAKRAGIIFTADSKILPKVELPTTTREWGNKQPQRKIKGWPVGLDGTDAKRGGVSFEYVSREDMIKWQGDPSDHPTSTLISYDVAGAAKDLQAGIAKAKPVGTYAVFYDPVALQKMSFGPSADFDAAQGQAYAAAYDEARENLRAQVKDFIKWLKAQGVI